MFFLFIFVRKNSNKNKMEKKQCSRCKDLIDTKNFVSNARTKDGLHYYCKDCQKEFSNYQKEYFKKYKRNPEIRFACSLKMKMELFNIAENLGIDNPTFFKMECRKILDSYSEKMKTKVKD